MSGEPVHWRSDPHFKAKKIKCACCNSCEWRFNKNGDCLGCPYGGPFEGYISKIDGKEVLQDD